MWQNEVSRKWKYFSYLQNSDQKTSSTKQFSKNGTVTEQRRTDSGTIVSYIIKKDNGRVTIRHRKFLRKLEPENDPIMDIIDTDLNNTDVTVDDTAGILRHE